MQKSEESNEADQDIPKETLITYLRERTKDLKIKS